MSRIAQSDSSANAQAAATPPNGLRSFLGRKSATGRALRLILTVLPLIWIARQLEPARWSAILRSIDPLLVVLAFACILSATWVGAVRWRLLFAAYGAQALPPVWTLFRYNLIAAYYNMLPGAVAGEVVRSVRTQHFAGSVTRSATVVAVDRFCGLLALLTIGAWAAARTGGELEGAIHQTLAWGMIIAFVLAVGALAFPFLVPHVRELVRSIAVAREAGRQELLWRIVGLVPRPQKSRHLLVAVGLGIVVQILLLAEILLLLAAVTDLDAARASMPFLPAILLLTSVPITPAALGQREVVFTTLLASVGIPAEAAVTTSIGVLVLLIGIALSGGAVAGWEVRPLRGPETDEREDRGGPES